MKVGHSVRLNQPNKEETSDEQTENSSTVSAALRPSIDFYLERLKNLLPNGVDEAKTSFILLSVGYRYLPSPNTPTTNRILLVATPRFPLKSKLVISDRNRGEVNFSSGDLTWRYRNRLQIEREMTVRSYHPTPYANIEVYYDSKYQKWSSTAIQGGCQFPIRSHSEIDVYYEHENKTEETVKTQCHPHLASPNSIIRLHVPALRELT